MTNESAYCLALAAIVLLSRFQAAKSGESISRRDEGRVLFLAIRLSGALLLAATLLYLVDPELMAWAALPLPTSIRWAGAGLGLYSILLFYWTLSTLGTNLTDTVATRSNHTLVTAAPYRWVRHPCYVTTCCSSCPASC